MKSSIISTIFRNMLIPFNRAMGGAKNLMEFWDFFNNDPVLDNDISQSPPVSVSNTSTDSNNSELQIIYNLELANENGVDTIIDGTTGDTLERRTQLAGPDKKFFPRTNRGDFRPIGKKQ